METMQWKWSSSMFKGNGRVSNVTSSDILKADSRGQFPSSLSPQKIECNVADAGTTEISQAVQAPPGAFILE